MKGWSKSSGIRLLHEHLQNKKAQQNQIKVCLQEIVVCLKFVVRKQRDSLRKVNLSSALSLNKSKAITEELGPPVITAINISYVGKESKGSLLGGDWDVCEEYDPFWPNDYEKIIKERKEKRDRQKESDRNRQIEDRERKRRERFDKPVVANRSLGLDYDDDEDDEDNEDDKPSEQDRDKDKEKSRPTGAMIAPPPSLLESSDSQTNSNFGVSSVAAKIMARMGYKEGQGLGREEQGISTALLVEKTSKRGGKIIHEKDTPIVASAPLMPPPPPPPVSVQSPTEVGTTSSIEGATESITEIMKNPSKVVLLRNMVGPGEVDDLLEPETKEECTKYGEVVKCIIFELTGTVTEEEAVRIFVEFKRVESAIKGFFKLSLISILYILSIVD